MRRGTRVLGTLACAVLACGSSGALAAGLSQGGVYTTEQAQLGAKVYEQNCAMCHGPKLQGTLAPALKGRNFRLMASNQNLTGDTLRRFIAAHMPATEPGALSATQYDDVTAYVLQQNGFPAGETKLMPNSAKLKRLYLSAFPRG